MADMNKLQHKRGFTLVEISIGVAIIGVLTALAIPGTRKVRNSSYSARIAKEMQVVGQAFAQYAIETGSYPKDKDPAILPEGMGDYLKGFAWTDDTVIGGQWDWDYEVFGVRAGVALDNPSWGDEQMASVDRIIDDGDLSKGFFRRRPNGYIYVLEL